MTGFLVDVVRWWFVAGAMVTLFSFVKNGMANPLAMTAAVGQHVLSQQNQDALTAAGIELPAYSTGPALPPLNSGVAENLHGLTAPGASAASARADGRTVPHIEVRRTPRRFVRSRVRKPVQSARVSLPPVTSFLARDTAAFFKP